LGSTKVRILAPSTVIRKGMAAKSVMARTSMPDACAMVSMSKTPGTKGMPGKWPSKTGLWAGTTERALRMRADLSMDSMLSTIWKYSRSMFRP